MSRNLVCTPQFQTLQLINSIFPFPSVDIRADASRDALCGGPATGRGLLAGGQQGREGDQQCVVSVLHDTLSILWQHHALHSALPGGFASVHQRVLQQLVLHVGILYIQGAGGFTATDCLSHNIYKYQLFYVRSAGGVPSFRHVLEH